MAQQRLWVNPYGEVEVVSPRLVMPPPVSPALQRPDNYVLGVAKKVCQSLQLPCCAGRCLSGGGPGTGRPHGFLLKHDPAVVGDRIRKRIQRRKQNTVLKKSLKVKHGKFWKNYMILKIHKRRVEKFLIWKENTHLPDLHLAMISQFAGATLRSLYAGPPEELFVRFREE